MRKVVWVLALGFVFTWSGVGRAETTVDALIKKLEEKGILTEKEATQIKGEIAQEEKKSVEEGAKKELPDWVKNIKINGDFRLRDQWEKTVKTGTTNYARNRGRLRARLNLEDQINNKVKVGIGVATDGGSPRSSNYTFGGQSSSLTGITNTDDFGKPQIVLHKAFAEYTPKEEITLIGGKMDVPFWEPDTFLWDDDFTPEGGAIQLHKKLNDMITPFANDAFFVLHDASPTSTLRTDPYIWASQAGIKGNLTDKVYYKTAGSWYNINNPAHFQLKSNSGTNTTEGLSDGSTGLLYNFSAIVGAFELGINDPFGETLSPLYIPQMGVFGQYEKNPNPSHNNMGWMAGAYIGNSKINGWGTWRLTTYYRVLERDAWLDAMTEDDFYAGDTSTSGYHSTVELGLAKNVWLKVTYYHTRVYKTFSDLAALSQKAPQDVIQSDINFKF